MKNQAPDEMRYNVLAADAFVVADGIKDPREQLAMRKIAWLYLRLARLARNWRRAAATKSESH